MKVALPVATLGDPDVVFLDEPITGLDAHVRKNLYRIIYRRLRDEGKGILLTSHYIEEAERVADYVLSFHPFMDRFNLVYEWVGRWVYYCFHPFMDRFNLKI